MRKPLRPCSYSGCGKLIAGGLFCPDHRERKKAPSELGYDHRWRRYAAAYLKKHPICCDPFLRHPNEIRNAEVCGHRIAHRGNESLLWNPRNHYPLCASCNAYQCAKFEGGFGHTRHAPPRPSTDPTLRTAFDKNIYVAEPLVEANAKEKQEHR